MCLLAPLDVCALNDVCSLCSLCILLGILARTLGVRRPEILDIALVSDAEMLALCL